MLEYLGFLGWMLSIRLSSLGISGLLMVSTFPEIVSIVDSDDLKWQSS